MVEVVLIRINDQVLRVVDILAEQRFADGERRTPIRKANFDNDACAFTDYEITQRITVRRRESNARKIGVGIFVSRPCNHQFCSHPLDGFE